MTLHECVLWCETFAMLNRGRPQGRVMAQAIRAIQQKCQRLDMPDDWRVAIEDTIARAYPPEGIRRYPAKWIR